MNTRVPAGYKSILSVYDTQKAIGLMKRLFEDRFAAVLNLFRVSAPLFVEGKSGLNDNLNGWERPVDFDIAHTGAHAQVVQSLAKWKRLALKRYEFYPGKGIYADMNAIRRDEDELDNLHSVYVDQWDWEKVILPENRNIDYLKSTVMDIVGAMCDTQDTLQAIYPDLPGKDQALRQLRHGAGAGGPLAGTHAQAAGARVSAGARHCLHNRHRRAAEVRKAARRPLTRLRRLEPERRHSGLVRAAGLCV